MCENWGYERLWKKIRSESISEMRHADELIARILYLEGTPNLQKLGKVNVGQTGPEQFRLDLELEKAAVTMLNQSIETCRTLGDHGSRDLLEGILKSEEEHANWIEAQLSLIQQAGEGNYLSQQIKEDDDCSWREPTRGPPGRPPCAIGGTPEPLGCPDRGAVA